MHHVRYQFKQKISYGILQGEVVQELSGDLFGKHQPTGTVLPLTEVQLLAPCQPAKIIAIGLNYRSHIGNRPIPTKPEMFLKTGSSVQHPEGAIVIPKVSAGNVHFEGELVIVMGKEGKHISVANAPNHILGYTCGNDVSERDWQSGANRDLQWARAKSSDTFSPFGPVIATEIEPYNLRLQTRLNGKLMQDQTTADLLFNVYEIVAHCSQTMSLQPGDLIFTGTPGQTEKMSPGDVVEVEIAGIGVLRNFVQVEK